MAMTSTGVFGQSSIHDPLRGPPPAREPQPPTNEQILRENIEKFVRGEITAAQLEVIKKTLS